MKLVNTGRQRRLCIFAAILGGLVAVAIVLGVCGGVGLLSTADTAWNVRGGAVTAITQECADIGRDILRRNGSAADAAIAILFCGGVSSAHTHGLGGGFVATTYQRADQVAESLIARETAPAASTATMFENVTEVTGAMSVAVPGELKGYAELHRRYGRLGWADLVRPTIELCRKGFPVPSFVAVNLEKYKPVIMASADLREMFINPATGQLFREAEIMQRTKLADTLEVIAEQGADSMYSNTGPLGLAIASDVQRQGGIIQMRDFVDYRVRWESPVKASIYQNLTMFSAPLPASGSVLTFLMHFVDGFLPADGYSLKFYARLIESFKFAYAKRTQLGDIHFVPEVAEIVANLTDKKYAEDIRQNVQDGQTSQKYSDYDAIFADFEDHGTAHVAVLAPNGDAVSVTSTINTSFGSKIVSTSTGILLNDQMDDFSTPGLTNAYGMPASPSNFIAPGKRPMSSMSPNIIVTPAGDVRMVVGAAGGPRITSSVAMTIVRHLWLNEPLDRAVNSPRVHHQLAPMHIDHDMDFDPEILAGLDAIGHRLNPIDTSDGFGAVSAVANDGVSELSAVTDIRRNGSAAIG